MKCDMLSGAPEGFEDEKLGEEIGEEGQEPVEAEEDSEPLGGVPMTEEEFEAMTEPLTVEEEAGLAAEPGATSGHVEAPPEVSRFEEGTTKRVSGPRAEAYLKARGQEQGRRSRGYFDYPSMRHGR